MSEITRPYIAEASQTYAPFNDAEFIDYAQLSEDRIVGIYRVNNGTPEGEEVLVGLPSDFGQTTIEVSSDECLTTSVNVRQKFSEIKEHARLMARDIFMVPDGEDGIQMALALPYDFLEMAQNTKNAFKNVTESFSDQINVPISMKQGAALIVAAGVLIGGMNTEFTSNPKVDIESSKQEGNITIDGMDISYTDTSTVISLPILENDNQDPIISANDAATASGISAEKVEVIDNKLILPRNVTKQAIVSATISAVAPDQKSAAPGEVISNPEISPAVQSLNDALANIDIHADNIDITAVRDAVIQMDAWYAPQDKDRMANMPAGYVKLLLPNEAVGLSVPMTVAERTANVERYTSPTMAAVDYVSAKILQQIIDEKYPDQKGAMWRLRDHQAPAHLTHNDGRTADISSSMGYEVTQYSDGPFADFQFSEDFNKSLTEDMFVQMSRYSDKDGPVISSILSSGETMTSDVNGLLGRNFIQRKTDHKDHGHVTLKDRFAMTQWRPRAADLPWTVDQDLRIAGMAQPISAEQRASQHAEFEASIVEQNSPEHPTEHPTNNIDETKNETPHNTEISPQALSPQAAQLIDTLDITQDRKEFLKKMLPSITAVSQGGAKINPEVVLAQTTLETGFGHDSLSGKTNNFFGIKAGKNWKGKVFVADTQEEYIAGDVVTIKDGFRVYDNPAQSVADYAELITNAPHYADAVRNYASAEGYVNGLFNEVDDTGKIIKEQGSEGVLSYGTDRGYEQKVLAVIDKYNYKQLVDAQVNSPTQPEHSTTVNTSDTTTTTEVIVDENSLINEDLFVDEDTAKHIYEVYFKDDEDGLNKWIQSLPISTGKNGTLYGINVANTPDVAKKGEQ